MTGPELRAWRLSMGLTQLGLALRWGCASDQTVWQWESGRRKIPGWVDARVAETKEAADDVSDTR